MALIVTAGYVTVETAVPGGRAQVDIPRGTELPDDVPAEQLDALLNRGAVEPVEVPVELEPEPVAPPAGPPPKGGAGSGVDAWTAYANAHGVAVPEGYGREQIRALLAEDGIAVD